MADSLLDVFRTLVRWRRDGDEADDVEGVERGFLPSPLDLSVRVGHGGQDDEAVRELTEIEERARDYEQYGRRD